MKFIRKCVTGVIENQVLMFKSRNLIKSKVNSKNKCFNYRKLGYWERDYILSNY